LLLTALLALVLGVFGAVYFERNEGPQVAANEAPPQPAQPPAATTPAAPAPPAAAPAENKPQEQATAPPESNPPSTAAPAPQTAQAPPATPAPAASVPSETLPQTQATNPAPSLDSEAQRLSQVSPSAAPANVAAAAPRYWVEFGAYETALYADRLKQNLRQLGIDASVTSAPGKNRQRYLRVRTSSDSDHAAAAAQLAKARSALHIAPLLHRAAAISPVPARPPEAQARPASSGAFWVQFGAFHERPNAEQVLSQLRRKDIQATVLERKTSDLKPLYLVRASAFGDHAQAEQIAQHGADALHSHDVLIGETTVAPGLHPRPPPR
jgi:cell division protein FtsN